MNKIIELKLLPDRKLFIKYSDNVEGVIDLAKTAHKKVHQELATSKELEKVEIDDERGDILINEEIELCKNATYEILKLKAQMKSFGINLDES